MPSILQAPIPRVPAGRVVELHPVPAGSAIALAERVLLSISSSRWLQTSLATALHRDAVDAVSDCELMLSILTARLEEIQAETEAASPVTVRPGNPFAGFRITREGGK